MQSAIKYLQHSTIDFLSEKIANTTDYLEANKAFKSLSGIEEFFRDQKDLLTLSELLKPCFMISEESGRREYGDFQTPSELSDSICSYLKAEGISPDVIVEPTFGKGSFLLSAIKSFEKAKRIYGVEIHESYYWQTKFSILEYFIENKKLHKPKIFLYLDNIFQFNFEEVRKSIGAGSVLILGNPPWITNSELGALNSVNLPEKNNFKALNGLDAITGKGNFDICEYIILTMINSFSTCTGHIAMLTKNSVIKNLVYDLPKMSYNINDAVALKFNAKEHFDASVDASLFKCSFGINRNQSAYSCRVSTLAAPGITENTFGWIGDKFVSDVAAYGKNKKYDGISRYVWRQGIKHDCSNVMELEMLSTSKYRNGFGKEIDIEEEPVYGLLKSSDLNSPVITQYRKYIIVTQKTIGESTSYIEFTYPQIYQYLKENEQFFEQRKSSIYKDKPPFSIFGIGDYSFKPFKVAISGLYKRSKFSLLLPVNGKPLMLDDTCYFLGFDNITEAVFVWAILNSEYIQGLLASITFLDAKRPYTKDVLMRLDISRAARDMTYEEIVHHIRMLDEMMLVHVSEYEWEFFLSGHNKSDANEKEKQVCLF